MTARAASGKRDFARDMGSLDVTHNSTYGTLTTHAD